MKMPFSTQSKADCKQAEMMIDQQLEATSLPLPEDAFLAVHLMACPSCRHYDQELRDITQTLDGMTDLPLPDNLVDRIMAKLPRAMTHSKRFLLPKAFPKTVAAVFFGAVVSLSLITYLASPPGLRQSLSVLPGNFSNTNTLSARTDDSEALISMGTETPKADAASSASLKDVVGF